MKFLSVNLGLGVSRNPALCLVLLSLSLCGCGSAVDWNADGGSNGGLVTTEDTLYPTC